MKSKIIYLLLVFLMVNTSCEEDYLREEIRDRITADNLYSTPEGFENGLNGLYDLVRKERNSPDGARLYGILWWSSTDNSYNPINIAFDGPWVKWGDFNNPSVKYYSEFWVYCYQTINAANTIINRAENPDIAWTSEEQKNEVIGTARLVRAWAYRHLVNMWGGVPLNLEESDGNSIKTDWERASVDQVLDQMIEDLLFAEEHLPEVHTVPGRVSKVVAQHYLAETYLMKKEYAKAEAKAQAAIDNPNYSLITSRYGVRAGEPGVPFMDQFYDGNVLRNQGNTEVLWAMLHNRLVPGGEDGNLMRRHWVPRYWAIPGFAINPETGRGIGFLGITKYGLDLYEPQDDRGSEYAIHRTITAVDGTVHETTTDLSKRIGNGTASTGAADPNTQDPYWANNWPGTQKYDDGDPEDPTANSGYVDQPYLRLAETYLLLAEAQLMQQKKQQAAATLNVLRARSNASPITAADVTIDFILDERSRELIGEEHRRYTLTRLDKWIERTKLYNGYSGGYITERDKLYPIPQDVIDANLTKEFPQNPGY